MNFCGANSNSGLPVIAVLIPCYNEQASVQAVIEGFREALPSAIIYVGDNNSTDRTVEIARQVGAVILQEPQQGKGHIIRRMFADIDADVYLMVDGDHTYDPQSAPAMVSLLLSECLDMVTATRVTDIKAAYRRGHRFGNRLLTSMVAWVFGKRVTDMLSGYRVFSRRYVKSFPVTSEGFEIETEITIHALELNLPLGEVESAYRERPIDSPSKLNTYRDGARVLLTILNLIRDQKPLFFFSILAAFSALIGISLSVPIIIDFSKTHLVPRFPTAFLCVGLVLLGALLFICGLILDSVSRGRKEYKRLSYLSISRFVP